MISFFLKTKNQTKHYNSISFNFWWLGINAQVVYRLLPDTNGGQDASVAVSAASADFFHINPEDGTLILVRSLDRETQSLHHLLVMASDQGNPSLSSTAHIWIRGLLKIKQKIEKKKIIKNSVGKKKKLEHVCFQLEKCSRFIY